MSSKQTKKLAWPPEAVTALRSWMGRAKTLNLDITAPLFVKGGGTRPVPSESAAVRLALQHAAACRCAEHEAEAKLFLSADPKAPVIGHDKTRPGLARVPTNPLRSMRLAAGLSQLEASRRMGITRGALSQSEQRATVSAAMVERARKAYG